MRLAAMTLVGVALLATGCGGLGRVDTEKELPVGCLAKPDPGGCGGSRTGYFYDYRDNRCKPVRYGSCGGTVPFETHRDCVRYCGAEPR